jgi:hypothetical protein
MSPAKKSGGSFIYAAVAKTAQRGIDERSSLLGERAERTGECFFSLQGRAAREEQAK